MLVTKHVQESCVRYHITAVNYNSEKNKTREREREKERKYTTKGICSRKENKSHRKIEVWRFLLDNNSKFSATLHKTHARIYIPIGALNCCKNELNCA